MNGHRLWQRKSLQKQGEPFPGHIIALRTAVEPAVPRALNLPIEQVQPLAVAGDPKVLVVTSEFYRQSFALLTASGW